MATGNRFENSREYLLYHKLANRNGSSTGPGLVTGSGSAAKVKWANTFNPVINDVLLTAVTTAEGTLAVPTNYAPGYASQVFIPANLTQTGLLTGPWPAAIFTIPVSSWVRLLIVHDGTTMFSLPSFIGLASAAAAPDAPPVPAGYLVLGDVTVKTDSTHTFIMATTNFSAAGITAVFRDLYWPDTGPSSVAGATALANVQ